VIVTPLPGRGAPAVLGALLSEGWEGTSAGVTAAGLEPWGYHLTRAPREAIEDLMRVAQKFGLDLLTGEDWAVMTGTRARLSALARSWTLPDSLAGLAIEIGKGLPADRPEFWRVRSGPVSLAAGPVFLVDSPFESGPCVLAEDTVECRLPGGTAQAAAEAVATGRGLVLTCTDPADAAGLLERALSDVGQTGLDPAQIAIDPGWGGHLPGPDLARFRALGCPLITTTESAVVAALALERGCQVLRTTAGPELLSGLTPVVPLLA